MRQLFTPLSDDDLLISKESLKQRTNLSKEFQSKADITLKIFAFITLWEMPKCTETFLCFLQLCSQEILYKLYYVQVTMYSFYPHLFIN